ncbi:MAG: hypothetical protein DI566_01030 [Microbacterium sp.]|nr:MAG: hypothetical protein DI566_01030 [Microbacterium sp.]
MHLLPTLLEVRSELATPTPSMTVNPDSVTPGFFGFVAIAVLAVVVVFLVIDMLRRIRRAGYRADVNEQLDAEAEADAQARAATLASDVDDEDIAPDVDGTGR